MNLNQLQMNPSRVRNIMSLLHKLTQNRVFRMGDHEGQNKQKKSAPKRFKYSWNKMPQYSFYYASFFLTVAIYYAYHKNQTKLTQEQEILQAIENGSCTKINITTRPQKKAVAHMKINGVNHYCRLADPKAFIQQVKQANLRCSTNAKVFSKEAGKDIQKFLNGVKIIMLILQPFLMVVIIFNSSTGKAFSKIIGRNESVSNRPLVTFKDVAGQENAKIEISQLVDFLKNPAKYHKIGARVPKGALLSGPPGTGKTMIAKACAGQAEVPFFSVSGSEFVELFAGMGAKRVRDLFRNAKKETPAILFIDEIDAIGRKRQDKFGGATDERANTLNQLLVEMDGFTTKEDIIILAATNRKEMLDPALTRPGRFDRIVQLQLPDIKGRQQILTIYLQKLTLNPNQKLQDYSKRISTLTFGFSGADLANLCNEAAILAVRKKKEYVELSEFQEASDRVLAGLKQPRNLSEKQKRKVAYHECGHAVIAWFLEGASPLLKITIIPRSKGSLGFAQYLPNEASLMTKQQLIDQLCVILGGRTAEEHYFSQITDGASNDLQKARKLAKSIIVTYGMSQKYPNYAPIKTEGQNLYSEATSKRLDEEVADLIRKCTIKARQLIAEKNDIIQKMAEEVLKKETLNHQEIKKILGQRPFPVKENYKEFLDTSKLSMLI